MSTEVLRAVQAHVAALNRGDLEDVLDTFTDDAVFATDGGTARGRDQLADLFDGVVGAERPTTILRATRQHGSRLACRLTRRFSVTDEQGRVAGAQDIEVTAVFTVTDGAISHVEVDPPT